MEQPQVFVPLGTTCAIAYQLEKYDFRKFALPFDWLGCTDQTICDVLEDDFSNFFDIDKMIVKNKSNNFPLLEDDWRESFSGTIRVRHKKYGFNFVHDFDQTMVLGDEQYIKIMDKYNRRINRFREIMKNPNTYKICIHIGNKFDINKCDEIMKKNSYQNYEIKSLILSEMPVSNGWQLDKFDWKLFFHQSLKK